MLAAKTSTNPTRILEFGPNESAIKILRPYLIIENPQSIRSQHQMRKKMIIIGSAPDADIVIDDTYVSKNHLSLKLTDRGFVATDLNSTNGTIINGAKIYEMHIVENQELTLGQSKLIIGFHSEGASESKPFSETDFCGMTGQSSIMRLLFAKIIKAAPTEMTVLVQGESGTGKEMVARALHDLSGRKTAPFVAINCGAISQNLVESELFGHEKGAFTGAGERHLGVFEQAHTGTLFLDEVGELSLETQSKLLRILEYGCLRRVGTAKDIQVDVRIVAATHRDLGRMVSEGTFREDLFFRLYVLPLKVPALKERKEDIAELATRFFTTPNGPKKTLSPNAFKKIFDHCWPGNVRELKNTILRAIALSEDNLIDAKDIEFISPSKTGDLSGNDARQQRELERFADAERIREALKSCDGNKIKAAAILGVGRSTIFRKIKNYGMSHF